MTKEQCENLMMLILNKDKDTHNLGINIFINLSIEDLITYQEFIKKTHYFKRRNKIINNKLCQNK